MDVSVDATAEGRASGPVAKEPRLKVRTLPRVAALQKADVDCQISPSSPLVNTSLDDNGWVCGRNRQGQLGVGTALDVSEPRVLRAPRRWSQISLGGGHAVAVTARGEAYTWGLDDSAQLGDPSGPSAKGAREPRRMDLLVGWNVRGVAAGGKHSVAWTSGDVITWGANDRGQCGHGERAERDWVKPRAIKALHDLLISSVVCGEAHTLCVTGTSAVFAWGRNSEGQLGLGDFVDRRAPARVDALWALPVVALAAGAHHSAALTGNGALFAWGGDEAGQLGLPRATAAAGAEACAEASASSTDPASATALALPLPASRRRPSRRVNQRFLSAMLDMGISRDAAELALLETGNVGVEVAAEWLFSVPQEVIDAQIQGDPGTPHDTVEHGQGVDAQHAAMLASGGGVVAAAAARAQGQAPITGPLGASSAALPTPHVAPQPGSRPTSGLSAATPAHPQQQQQQQQPALPAVSLPRRVALQGVKAVAAGSTHTVAATEDAVYTWGVNPWGALGLGAVGLEEPVPPTRLEGVPGAQVASLAAGPSHTLVLCSSGIVYGFGDAHAFPGGEHVAAGDDRARILEPRPVDLSFLHRKHSGPTGLAAGQPSNMAGGIAAAHAPDAAAPMEQDDASSAAGPGDEPAPPPLPPHGVMRSAPSCASDLSSVATSAPSGSDAVSVSAASASSEQGAPGVPAALGRRGGLPAAPASPVPIRPLPRPARVSLAVAGNGCSAFLTRGADEPAARRVPRLWERLAAAAAAARAAPSHERESRLRPLGAAVERVYGSAAAVCAAFGLRDRVGLDCELLERVTAGLLELEGSAMTATGVVAIAGDAAATAATPGRGAPSPGAARTASGAAPMDVDGSAPPAAAAAAAAAAAGASAAPSPGSRSHRPPVGPSAAAPGSIRAHSSSSSGGMPPSRRWIFEGLKRGAEALLGELERHAALLGTPERALVLLAACQCAALGDANARSALVPRLAAAVLLAPRAARRLLVRWWSAYPPALLEKRVVAPLQRYLTDELYATKKLTLGVMNVIKVLALVEEANQQGRLLPPEAFYNELISDKLDVLDHYVAWRQTHDAPAHAPGADGPFSFCSYPFLLNPRAKSKLLHTEARIQMDQTVAACRAEAAATGSAAASPTGRLTPPGGFAAAAAAAAAAGAAQAAGEGGAVAPPSLSVPPASLAEAAAALAGSPTGRSTLDVPNPDDCVVPSKVRIPRAPWVGSRAHEHRGRHAAPASGAASASSAAAAPATPDGSPARRDRGHAGSSSPLRWLFSSLRAGDESRAEGAEGGDGAEGGAAAEGGVTPSGPSGSSSSYSSASGLPPNTPPRPPPLVVGTGGRALPPHAAAAASPNARAAARTATSDGPLWKQGSLHLPPPEESGFPGTHPDMCILRIRRTHLLEDALDEIARQKPKDLFKPLRVHFIGEEGIDAGGVKKEFFQLLVAEVLCPDYGMLSYQPESRTYWFCPSTLEGEGCFLLLGLVLGLAIYNGVLLDFPLPLALYRKLLGAEVGLRDLEDMQPALGRSLRALLAWDGPEGSVADVFGQCFEVEVAGFGDTRVVELKPGGSDVPVTEDNRREFVDLYVDFWLNRSVHAQFEAFARGFLMLVGGPALQLFSATELERLVCGNPHLDFDALARSARYEAGYHAQHRVITWLWEVVATFDDDEKRLFLKFFTGSDRAPIGGLGNLRCIVQRDGADSDKLPTSHTCFNTLLLPSYRSKEKLDGRLRLAILNAEGFGLE